MLNRKTLTLVFGIVIFLGTGVSFAEPVELVTPSAIVQTAGDAGQPFVNLINDSGLSGTPDATNYATITHGGGTWYTNTVGLPNYFDGTNPPPQFILSLDRKYQLTDLIIWGYGGNNNEASDFTVEFSDDTGANYHDSVDVATSALLGSGTATLDFGGLFSADVLRITMTDNAGGRGFSGGGSGDRVGLGEIKFMAQLPEPSTLLLASFGLIALAFGRYRRRSR